MNESSLARPDVVQLFGWLVERPEAAHLEPLRRDLAAAAAVLATIACPGCGARLVGET